MHKFSRKCPSRLAATVLLCSALGCTRADEPPTLGPEVGSTTPIRIALFNVKELSTSKLAAERVAEFSDAPPPEGVRDAVRQVDAAIAVVQRIQPHILVLQEIDQGPDEDPAAVARQFAQALDRGPTSVRYDHLYAGPSNTGRLSGIDLNSDGTVATEADQGTRTHGNDSFGYGSYPGQYAMAVLSQLPLATGDVRSFQRLLWRDLPGNHMEGAELSEEAASVFRLSSKSHWDLPIDLANGERLHLLVSHPTPPAFDGDEDRNGRRNFDEIRLWALYLDNHPELVDDQGDRGGLAKERPFIIAGDLNAYPGQQDSNYDGRTPISQLLEHPRVQDAGSWLTSDGALQPSGEAAGPPNYRERATAGFRQGLRIDYVLPSQEFAIEAGGVFWPDSEQDPEGAALAAAASDHRLVWLDLRLPTRER